MNSVKRRYILFGIILTVIVTVGLIFEYIHLNEIITSEKKESIDRSLEYLRYQINSNLKLHSQYAVAAAEYISLGNWTEDGVKEYFEKIMENDPYIKSVYFKDKDNRLIATDSANSPKSYEEDKVEETYTAGLLHDIGKIAISDDALNNYEPYSNKGWEKIKKHPEIGYRILSTVNEMGQIAEYVLYHHERYDGLGHPKGLKGKEIPLVSRIIAIVDTYEMLSSDMPNKKAILEDEVIEKLLRNAGTHFDPELVEIFIEKVLNIKLMKLN